MKLRAGTISTDPFSVPLARAHFFCRSRHLFQVCSLYPVPLLPGHCKQSLWLCTVSSTLAAGPQPPGSAGKSLASVDKSPAGSLQAVTVTLHMHLLQGHSHREALVNNSQVSTNHPTAGSLYPVPLLLTTSSHMPLHSPRYPCWRTTTTEKRWQITRKCRQITFYDPATFLHDPQSPEA